MMQQKKGERAKTRGQNVILLIVRQSIKHKERARHIPILGTWRALFSTFLEYKKTLPEKAESFYW